MKYVIINRPKILLGRSLPPSWDVQVLHPEGLGGLDVTKHQFYVGNDAGYDALSRHDMITNDRGFCNKLSLLANDKYRARSVLKSLQDMPFTISTDNVVNWPYDKNDDLIAKPVHGTGSRNVIKTKHNEVLPDIGEDYIIEKYIDDKYQRISVDGYCCGDEVGILTTCDNVYFADQPTKFNYLGHPSKYHDHPKLKERFVEIVRELKEVTGCDNQIIDVEFFAIGDNIVTMEINPRILFNSIPLYEEVAGVNPWVFMDSLKRGVVPDIPSKPPRSGVIRYNYVYAPDEPIDIPHDENTFSIFTDTYSHTYHTSAECKPHEELIKDLDEKYPTKSLLG